MGDGLLTDMTVLMTSTSIGVDEEMSLSLVR